MPEDKEQNVATNPATILDTYSYSSILNLLSFEKEFVIF